MDSMTRRTWNKVLLVQQILLVVLVANVVVNSADAEDADQTNKYAVDYDIKLGVFNVGSMRAEIDRTDTTYSVDGSLEAGGPIKRFLNLHGEFATHGVFDELQPITTAYVLIQNDERKKQRKVTVASEGTTRVHRNDKDTMEYQTPEGTDIFSLLLLHDKCVDGINVYEGDDPFKIKLRSKKEDKKLSQGRKHFSGTTDQCLYNFEYEDGEVRKVQIWLGELDGRVVPVRIRISVPFVPDGVFKLRLPQKIEEETTAIH